MQLTERFVAWAQQLGAGEESAQYLGQFVHLLSVALLAWIAAAVTRSVFVRIVDRIADRTRTHWDDALVNRRVFHWLAHLAPGLVIYSFAPAALDSPDVIEWVRKLAQIYMLVVGALSLDAALNAGHDIYRTFEVSKRIPIYAYVQVVKLLITLAAVIVTVSLLIDKSPLLLLSGLGAATAILLLVFKDTILGLVAGIQLVAQDMVRPGDWIEMAKYGADGDVEEITLNVVKIRNFDKTVTTIPTYALISDAFRNWRGMQESGGRRIKRALSIDLNTIGFLDDERYKRLTGIKKLRPYLEERRREIALYNEEYGDADLSPANGRRMTNIGAFRAYCQLYLREHPKIDTDMTFLVRQLAPTSTGLPIEIYVFSREQRWVQYEGIQADIFDHLIAVLPLFDLRAYQEPSGLDITRAGGALELALERPKA
ncbi:MAG: mechanosensitive ion channel [Bryobacterales bacterium]|nr:mechanosensitive ion channel [Acidobacteriota bacterium]MCB9384277.1 mechanosensitive ion channel [Bryobacterales bacterium]